MLEKEKCTIAFCQRSIFLQLLALLIQEEILLSETRSFGHADYNHLLLDSMGAVFTIYGLSTDCTWLENARP